MRLKLLTLALALASLSPLCRGEDLIGSYREARANDPVLSQADATRLATGEGINQARALLLPQISGGLTLQQTSGGSSSRGAASGTGVIDATGAGHVRSRNVSATLSQTVLDLRRLPTSSPRIRPPTRKSRPTVPPSRRSLFGSPRRTSRS